MEPLVQTLTARYIETQQEMLECEAAPACDARALRAAAQAGLEKELADLLGPEKNARLHAYIAEQQRTVQERNVTPR